MPTIAAEEPRCFEEFGTETVPGLDLDALLAMHDSGQRPVIAGSRLDPVRGWLLGNLGRLMVAVTVVSAPINYADVREDPRRSGASAVMWSVRQKRGRSISLGEARKMALRILADTDRRLSDERAREVLFLMQVWDQDDATNT